MLNVFLLVGAWGTKILLNVKIIIHFWFAGLCLFLKSTIPICYFCVFFSTPCLALVVSFHPGQKGKQRFNETPPKTWEWYSNWYSYLASNYCDILWMEWMGTEKKSYKIGLYCYQLFIVGYNKFIINYS